MEPRSETLPETVEVRPAHRFDTGGLQKVLGERLGATLQDLRQMRGGQSNPTFLLLTDRGEFVLRKQPPGKLLPSAHAIDREFRVLSALSKTDVPVPRPIFYCEDAGVIGTPFYVMERMRGRVFWSSTLPELRREERKPIYLAMADALARLHIADWRTLGLSDYGRPGSYFARQVARWSKQWQNSRCRENPAVDKLAEWLPRHIPPGDEDTAIVHGDFRLDNVMFHPSEPRVIAIFDWELSTLGHPLADLAYTCIRYRLPSSLYGGMMDLDLAELGLPDENEFLDAYRARSGREAVLTPFHFAFSLFRIAVILEGVYARALTGNASSGDDALRAASVAIALADRGWEIANE